MVDRIRWMFAVSITATAMVLILKAIFSTETHLNSDLNLLQESLIGKEIFKLLADVPIYAG